MQKRFSYGASARLTLAILFVFSIAASGRADDASAWVEDNYSKLRLIAGNNTTRSPMLRAGIEMELQPGWKTYWRYPGDSGVPPRFVFAGSRNVKTVKLLWPAPQRFVEAGSNSIGYHERVIFPLHVVPNDPARPVILQADVHYAVCKNLCVPAARMRSSPPRRRVCRSPHGSASLGRSRLIPFAATTVARFRASSST
jgi:DsbC/DsbD-like thiol-disulfide interchange protein